MVQKGRDGATRLALSNGKIHTELKYSTEFRACEYMKTEFRALMGARLREERERLGFSQANFGAMAEVSLRTEQDWERGVAAVSSEFLAIVAQSGVDVLYVITGERLASRLSLDPIQTAVLGSLALCSPQRQMDAVQHMALLAAGMSPQTPAASSASVAPQTPPTRASVAPQVSTVTKAKVSKTFMGLAVGTVGRRKKED